MGKGLDVGKEVFAQVGDDALAHPLQDDRLQIGAAHRKDQHTPIDGHADVEAPEREIAPHKLFDIAHDEGRCDVIGDGKEDEKAHHDELVPVRLGVTEEAA